MEDSRLLLLHIAQYAHHDSARSDARYALSLSTHGVHCTGYQADSRRWGLYCKLYRTTSEKALLLLMVISSPFIVIIEFAGKVLA
jgi:hypothetical protein